MIADTLDPQRTAILFFDMLNGHVKKDDPKTEERYRPVVAASAKLMQGARAHNVMVAYAHANHRADNATSAHLIRDTNNRLKPIPVDQPPEFKPIVSGGTWESQVIDELGPRDEDYLIPKYRWSAFYQTYLDLALRSRKIDTLVVAGGSTDVGVASTAFAGRDMDYNLVFARDACSSPEKDNHDQLMDRVFPRMGRVRSVSEIVAMLDTGAKV
ncbi:MAG: cysteine hydrolase [Marinobacter sp.]|uniref:cysteine hydrolase n=1 Tax=Marinobacter sp. TaxID=50741 RepID=UPI0034A07AA5